MPTNAAGRAGLTSAAGRAGYLIGGTLPGFTFATASVSMQTNPLLSERIAGARKRYERGKGGINTYLSFVGNMESSPRWIREMLPVW